MNLTVVIPTIGRSSLEHAVTSALALDETKQVLIVTDTTVKLKPTFKDRVKIICIDQADACSKRNAGLLATKTELVLFLDDDDALCMSNNLSAFQYYIDNPYCIGLVFDAYSINKSGKRLIKKKPGTIGQSDLIFRNVVGTTSSVVLKTRYLQDNKIQFDSRNSCRQDFDLWIRILNEKTKYLFSTSETGLLYNDTPQSGRISKQKLLPKLKSLFLQYLRHVRLNRLLVFTLVNHSRYLFSSIFRQ